MKAQQLFDDLRGVLNSFYDNETILIRALLRIHNKNNPIDCDPMYNKGHFYLNSDFMIEKPQYRFDINPHKDCLRGDARDLPLADNSIQCIILDPPFMFGSHGKTDGSRLTKRYTMFNNFDELENCYVKILAEAYRVLKKGGICIFKCQDYTDSITTMTHCLVWKWACDLGFYPKDIAILNLKMSKISKPALRQRHLRKTHCYFWVFQKQKGQKNGQRKTV